MKKIILSLIATGLLFISCNYVNTKDQYLKDFDRFVSTAEVDLATIRKDDWLNVEQKYDQFTTEMYNKVSDKLTPEDQQTIGKLKIRFEKVRFQFELKQLEKKVTDGVEQIKGAAKEIVN